MLQNKVAIVTGSASGIGLGIAHALAQQGASIVRNGFGKPEEIVRNRVNQITFNASLLKELRAVELAQRMVAEGCPKEEHQGRLRQMLVHAIRNDVAMAGLSISSKLSPDWKSLTRLRGRGRATAARWLDRHFDDLGATSTLDLRHEFRETRE